MLKDFAPTMDAKDMEDISFILSADYLRSPASRARVKALMEQAVDAQPHRADLWQLYLNLELQAQKNVDFRSHGGDLCVQIRGALVFHQPPSKYRFFTSCASVTWSTDVELAVSGKNELPQVSTGKQFFTYSQASSNYSEVVFDEETSFAVHQAFEFEMEETLSLQLCRQGMDEIEEGIRLPAMIIPSSQAPPASESSLGQLNLPVRTLASCRTTLEVEILEGYGIITADTSAPNLRCFRGTMAPPQLSCKIQCVPAGSENGFMEETPWVDVQTRGRAALGFATTFFLPALAASATAPPSHLQQGVAYEFDQEENSTQSILVGRKIQQKEVNIEQQRIMEQNRVEYVLQKGANIPLWSMSGGNEHLTTKDTSTGKKGDVYNGKGRIAWQEEEFIKKAWDGRDRLLLSVLSRKSDTERPKLMGSCLVALKDLEHNAVYDQWFPLQGGDTAGGFVRVRLRRRDVPRGEISEPVWIPLARSSASTVPAMYVKVAIGFIPRQPDLMQVRATHKFDEVGDSTAEPQLKCHALVQAGAIVKNIDLGARPDVSMEIDDHTSVVRVGILGTLSTQLASELLCELIVVPCPDAGARILRIEEGYRALRSWEALKVVAAFGPRVAEARKEARILFLEWMQKHSKSKCANYADFAQASLTTKQLQNALSEYGLTEGEINELLIGTDENCDGDVTMHEFDRYGMRFISPVLAEFYAKLTVEQCELKRQRQNDLMLLARRVEISLSRLPTPGLYEALSFYCNHMKQWVCCCLFCCCFPCHGSFSTSFCSRRAGSAKSSEHISGSNMGVSETNMTQGRKRGMYDRFRHFRFSRDFGKRRQEDGRSDDEDGQSENTSLEGKLVTEDALSGHGFSRTMKRGQQVNIQLRYTSRKRDQAAQVHGILDLEMRLTPGAYLDTTNDQALVDAMRSLFLRILSCKQLTSRQISRFAHQCERWEKDVQLAHPHALPATIASSLSPVAERSFEDGFFEDNEDKVLFVETPNPVDRFSKRPIPTTSRPSSARPASGRRERPLPRRPSSARSFATTRPLSSRFGSITPISPMFSHHSQASPFASGRNTPEYQQVADVALWNRVKHLKATVSAPAYLSDGSNPAESSSEGESSSDDTGGSDISMHAQQRGASERAKQSADTSRARESSGKSQLARPTTAPTAIEARARRSVLLQDMSIPWSEVVASGCLSTWTPVPSSPSEMTLDRLLERDNASQQGHRILRAMSARRFRGDAVQGRPKTAHPSTQANRAQRLGGETLEPSAVLPRRDFNFIQHLKVPGSLDDDGSDENTDNQHVSVEAAAWAESSKEEGESLNSAEIPLGAGWNRGLHPHRNSQIRPFTAGAHSEPHSFPSDLRAGNRVVQRVKEAANPGETKKPATDTWSNMPNDERTVPDKGKVNEFRRPATAGRTISAQFAQSRQASLNRLLCLSGSTPVSALSEEASNVQSGHENDHPRVQSPFRLLDGRKKMSRDLAESLGGAGKNCRPANANPTLKSAEVAAPPEIVKTVPNVEQASGRHAAAGAADISAGGQEGRRRPATAAPAGRVQLQARSLEGDTQPRWAREGGITPSVHRLHCTLEDRVDICGWRSFDELSPEKKDVLLSYMKPAERWAAVPLPAPPCERVLFCVCIEGLTPVRALCRNDFLESPTNARAQVAQQPQPPHGAVPASTRPSTARGGGTRGTSPPRAHTSAGSGAKVKDIWKARAGLKLVRTR
jgi:hypothetical protein